MSIHLDRQVNFTYTPPKPLKKASLFKQIIEPLRAAIGQVFGKT